MYDRQTQNSRVRESTHTVYRQTLDIIKLTKMSRQSSLYWSKCGLYPVGRGRSRLRTVRSGYGANERVHVPKLKQHTQLTENLKLRAFYEAGPDLVPE